MATKKQIAIGCFVAFALVFMGTIFTILIVGGMSMSKFNEEHEKWVQERYQKRTAEIPGTITEYKEVRGTKTNTDKYITFEYEVNGTKYSYQHIINNGHPVTYGKGVKGKVCYDPTDPKENASFTLDVNRKCGE